MSRGMLIVIQEMSVFILEFDFVWKCTLQTHSLNLFISYCSWYEFLHYLMVECSSVLEECSISVFRVTFGF